jgi:lipoprotein-anchoring transpeptidase ErfK/SrfK
MHRTALRALLAGASFCTLCTPVTAGPIALDARAYGRAQPIASAPAPMPLPEPAVAAPEPLPIIQVAGQMGGGFIEFLFSGAQPQPQYAPQPAPVTFDPNPRSPGYRDPYADDPRYQQQPVAVPQMQAEPRQLNPRYLKQTVPYPGREPAGTIVIDTPNKFLYLVQGNGTAIRYGVGVGRPGFLWAGTKQVSQKREWPDWTPPPEMLQRRPDLPRHMEGGPQNPLGARALYLGSSLYRIHGSNEPWTIGTNVSSGCIRMRNEDVMDLYERVRVGTKVVVI